MRIVVWNANGTEGVKFVAWITRRLCAERTQMGKCKPVSSSAANSGIIHMMATSPFVQQQLPALPTQ